MYRAVDISIRVCESELPYNLLEVMMDDGEGMRSMYDGKPASHFLAVQLKTRLMEGHYTSTTT